MAFIEQALLYSSVLHFNTDRGNPIVVLILRMSKSVSEAYIPWKSPGSVNELPDHRSKHHDESLYDMPYSKKVELLSLFSNQFCKHHSQHNSVIRSSHLSCQW